MNWAITTAAFVISAVFCMVGAEFWFRMRTRSELVWFVGACLSLIISVAGMIFVMLSILSWAGADS